MEIVSLSWFHKGQFDSMGRVAQYYNKLRSIINVLHSPAIDRAQLQLPKHIAHKIYGHKIEKLADTSNPAGMKIRLETRARVKAKRVVHQRRE